MSDLVPASAAGLPSTILAFPSHLAREPNPSNGLFDKDAWNSRLTTALVADQFRDDSAGAKVAQLIVDYGAGEVALILERNASALSALRAVVATLSEADRRIADAAPRWLDEKGHLRTTDTDLGSIA